MLALVVCWFSQGELGGRAWWWQFPQVFQASVASDSIDLVMIEVQKHLGLRVN